MPHDQLVLQRDRPQQKSPIKSKRALLRAKEPYLTAKELDEISLTTSSCCSATSRSSGRKREEEESGTQRDARMRPLPCHARRIMITIC